MISSFCLIKLKSGDVIKLEGQCSVPADLLLVLTSNYLDGKKQSHLLLIFKIFISILIFEFLRILTLIYWHLLSLYYLFFIYLFIYLFIYVFLLLLHSFIQVISATSRQQTLMVRQTSRFVKPPLDWSHQRSLVMVILHRCSCQKNLFLHNNYTNYNNN